LSDNPAPDASQRLAGQGTVGASPGQAHAHHVPGDGDQLDIAAILLDAGAHGLDDLLDQCTLCGAQIGAQPGAGGEWSGNVYLIHLEHGGLSSSLSGLYLKGIIGERVNPARA
jgi:hypothetical protein